MAPPTRQYAALPWRETGQGVEVLLITSRETRRWVIPKGWPVTGLSPPQSAAREAFEEAGVGGRTGLRPVGRYRYDKRIRDGALAAVDVIVFDIEVMIQHREWPEQAQRQQKWMRAMDAAALVWEPGLQAIIRTFTGKPPR